MFKFVKYAAGCMMTAALLFIMICLDILLLPVHTFDSSYQATIRAKYELLMETNDPKIVFVSGSSGAFGLNAKEIEEATGYKVVNLGLHAGFGFSFISEIAKANINPGDIVLLAYEYNWPDQDSFQSIGTDLVMSGIGNHLSMYRFVLPSQWKSVVGYLPEYAVKKNEFQNANGLYSREGFSADGNQMVIERTETYELKPESVIHINAEISQSSMEYLRKMNQYIIDRGGTVYFVAAPYAKGSIDNPQDLLQLAQNEENLLGIRFLSDPEEYAFDCDLMFDTKYHCNSKGEEKRTKLLMKDLKRAGIGLR